MAATPEKLVKNKIKVILQDGGVYYAMPIGSGYGNAGVPDFLACVNGRFLAVEAKAGKGKTTALQDMHLEKIKTAGGVSMVVNELNLDQLKETIKWMNKK
jgi:Holliday junction resolvase